MKTFTIKGKDVTSGIEQDCALMAGTAAEGGIIAHIKMTTFPPNFDVYVVPYWGNPRRIAGGQCTSARPRGFTPGLRTCEDALWQLRSGEAVLVVLTSTSGKTHPAFVIFSTFDARQGGDVVEIYDFQSAFHREVVASWLACFSDDASVMARVIAQATERRHGKLVEFLNDKA